MKKSQMQWTLGTILLFAFIAIVVLILAGQILGIFQETNTREVCRLSIIAAAKTDFKILGRQVVASPIKLKCKMLFMDVDDKGVSINGNLKDKFGSTDAEEKLKRAVANEMYDCWYQVADVNASGENPFGGFGFTLSETKCLLCTRIKFAKDFKKAGFTNFKDWLNSNGPLGRDTKYSDYFGKDVSGTESISAAGTYYLYIPITADISITKARIDPKIKMKIAGAEDVEKSCTEIYN